MSSWRILLVQMAKDDTWLREELFHNLEHVAPFYNGSMHGGLRKSSSASFFSKVGHSLPVELSIAPVAAQCSMNDGMCKEASAWQRLSAIGPGFKTQSLMLPLCVHSLNYSLGQ